MSSFNFEALWWMLWIGAAGACVGSFLNMLIYRLPRERSLFNPLHSFCPSCEAHIRWYDNVPLVSYLLLAGRCRTCAAPIPLRYPLIEGLSALSFMLVLDAFFIGAVRSDLASVTAFGVSGQVGAGWSLLIGHLVLVAGLLAISAMDLEDYYVDIRLTWFIAAAGLLSHAFHEAPALHEYELSPGAAGATVGALVGLCVSWAAVSVWERLHMNEPAPPLSEASPGHPCDTEPEQPAGPSESGSTDDAPDESCLDEAVGPEVAREPNPIWGCAVAVLGLVGIVAWALCVSLEGIDRPAWPPAGARFTLVFGLFFIALVGSSIRRRPADAFIVQVIEGERHRARGVALCELLYLMPALALGIGAGLWLAADGRSQDPGFLAGWLDWLGSSSWHPIRGLLWAALSMLIGGAVGWGVRIFFTLVLGKEALGLGDVHIMWAAAAVTGWTVVVLGFFAAAFLAVVGMILLLGFKRSRAIPFGPWLALGALLVVIARQPILRYLRPATDALEELSTRAGL